MANRHTNANPPLLRLGINICPNRHILKESSEVGLIKWDNKTKHVRDQCSSQPMLAQEEDCQARGCTIGS